MEFVIQKSVLQRELQTVSGVVEKRATIPILANVLIEASGNRVRVGASDLEVTVQGAVDANVVHEGAVTMPAAKLSEIVRALPDAEVQFKLLDGNQMSITCERVKFKIPGQSREDFPKFPAVDLSKGIRLSGRILHEMILRVEFAITTEDPRYSLNGALLRLEPGKITMVATDGHRLAYVSRKSSVDAPKEGIRVIVPRKAISEVSKLTADTEDDDIEVTFGRQDNHLFFHAGRHLLTSTVLEGNFPKYENVMPKRCGIEVVVPTEELSQAIRRVSLVASDRFGRAVRFSLSGGSLELSSRTEMGEAEETLPVDYDGEAAEIGFNARYLLDFLSVVGTPSVRVELKPEREGDDKAKTAAAGDRPGQFRPEPQAELDYRYIVMPMHL